MTWSLPEPMLTGTVASAALPSGRAAEPKWGGNRAQLAVYAGLVPPVGEGGSGTL
ncbi:hypothetical protein ACISU4_01125 [Streptomyces wuyuanensis]|uniref:hypothetical protein n=1 Tax=Streptomyces wuyuanensis TaxID=1196353 RepID=UPI003801A1A2